jgi:hypothetical protein
MNGEFEKVKAELPSIMCNTMAAKEHTSKAKHSIGSNKEQTRGIVRTPLFEFIPQCLKTEFIYFLVFWLNTFPAKTKVSGFYSPQELL